jgi:hypothetical protein
MKGEFMKKLLITSVSLLSLGAFAQVNYTKCNIGEYGKPYNISSDGKLTDYTGQEYIKDSVVDGVETYKIPGGGYGGVKMPDHYVSVERDKDGNIAKLIDGEINPSKKTINSIKEMQLNMQSMGGFPGGGFGGYGISPSDRSFMIKDDQGNFYNKRLKKLTKEDKAQLGLSKEDIKAMKSDDRKSKKIARKARRAYKKLQNSGRGVYRVGSESNFSVKDGECTLKDSSVRMYSEKDKKVISYKSHSREACVEVSKIEKKYRAEQQKCSQLDNNVYTDMSKSFDKLKDISPIGGIGVQGGGIGYMSSNPIQSYANTCRSSYPDLFKDSIGFSPYGAGSLGTPLSNGGGGFGF